MGFGSVLLRFRHHNADLTFISSLLNMPCLRTWIAGSDRETPLGDPLPGKYRESYWVSQLEFSAETGFYEKLIFIVERLASVKKDICEFRASGGQIEIYLQLPGSVNHGGSIKNSVIKTISELGVDLLIEVFPGS